MELVKEYEKPINGKLGCLKESGLRCIGASGRVFIQKVGRGKNMEGLLSERLLVHAFAVW
jgi:hypothetical protein